jgi:hypothetical protein
MTTFDNGIGILYVDGIAGPPASIDGGITLDLSGTTYVGAFNSTQYFWQGYLDEIAMYDYVLPQSQADLHTKAGNLGSVLMMGASCVEQDSFDDVANCVETIIRTPYGFRQDNITFGFPSLELLTQPVTSEAIRQIIAGQETRASLIMDEQPDTFDPLIDRVTVEVGQMEGGAGYGVYTNPRGD